MPRKLRSVSPCGSLLYGSEFSQRCTASGVRRRSTIRRSADVKERCGGLAGSVRGSGSRFEVGNEIGWRPHIARANLDEPAVGVNHRGAQIVSENGGTFLARLRD